jgi:urease accessory protein
MLAAQVTDNSYKGWQASLALQFCHTPEKTSCTPLITSGRSPFSVHFIPKVKPATFIYCTRRAVVGGDAGHFRSAGRQKPHAYHHARRQ